MAQVPARTDRRSQLTKQTGDAWENQARRWLESRGLHFIAANARERGGEIDLIMRDGAVTVFVEVRYRRSASYGDAASSVTQKNNKDSSRLLACGSPGRMGALTLWIAVSMW
jgi:putative endonuclease